MRLGTARGRRSSLPLVVPLFEGFYDASNLLSCSAGKSGHDVLDRRLEQADDIPDEFLATLDGNEGVEVLVADIDAILYEGCFQDRLSERIALAELLDNLGGCLVRSGEHNRGGTVQNRFELVIRLVYGCERFFQQRGLYDHLAGLFLDALAAREGVEPALRDLAARLGLAALEGREEDAL